MIFKGNHVKFARFVLLASVKKQNMASIQFFVQCIIKQLLDFRSVRLRLITLTSTLIILDITKTSSNNCRFQLLIVRCYDIVKNAFLRLTKLLLLKEHLEMGLNINWDTLLFSDPVADAIFSFSSFLFIIVHATNSIKFKVQTG